MQTSIKITDVRDVPTVGPKGELTTDVLVTYVVDGQRVYQTRVPKGKSDLPSVQAVIQKEELERQKLVNQEFKIG